VLAACKVNGRQEVRFVLPGAEPGARRRLRLRVLGGGAPAPGGDPRRLNLRVLRASWALARPGEHANGAASRLPPALLRADVVPTPGLRLGDGWQPFECERDETFRWLGGEAEVRFEGVRAPASLVLEVEPGPSVPRGKAWLHVRDADGRELAQEPVERRRTVTVPLSEAALAKGRVRLVVPGGRPASRRDPRLLNLRVLECGIAAAALEAPAAPPPAAAARDEAPALLHTNACGDFTLLAREHWFALRGYPELEVFSMNIDSFTCYAAHYGGAPEVVLPEPMRIYHIEHATGSGWTPEGEQKLFARIAAKGIPIVDYQQILDWARQMRDQGPLIFNGEDWGLAGHDLPETVIESR
jgi:hypothetical protein